MLHNCLSAISVTTYVSTITLRVIHYIQHPHLQFQLHHSIQKTLQDKIEQCEQKERMSE